MELPLEQESEKLARSWLRHDPALLRDYLVAGVQDPRLNLQSILSRHFLLRALGAEGWRALMDEEYRFAAAMNGLLKLATQAGDGEELAEVLHALKQGGDNAEGLELPRFIVRTFARLPTTASGLTIPNYIESFLAGTQFLDRLAKPDQPSLDTFRNLWRAALAAQFPSQEPPASGAGVPPAPGASRPRNQGAPDTCPASLAAGRRRPISVLEPACGSANDYRFLAAYGLAPLVDYYGFDLCARNIENARALFPGVRFDTGNVFAIAAADKSFDLCIVHDLFEHLSLAGLETAVKEICRVTRQGICAGFFNMDEIPAHQVRPLRDYHWNTLSMARLKELFANSGFTAQVLHIGTFLRRQTGCDQTQNPNAYTFLLLPAA
jgi:SAM-dependent methyltransferase